MVTRQLAPVALVALAVFLVAMPVSTAAIPDISVFNVEYTHDQLKFRFWADELTYAVVLGAAVFGMACALRSFRFLLVKCEATAVLSLPLSRTTLFGVRFVACLLALVVGIGVPLCVSLVVNVAALAVWPGLFGQFFYVLAGLLVVGAVACAVTVCACAVAGTTSEAVAFACALLASVSVAAWGLNEVMSWMLVGNAFGETLLSGTMSVAPSLLEATAAFNPLLFFVQEAADHQTFLVQHPVYYPQAGNGVLLGAWAVVLVALVALACVLVRRRRGEKAGIAGLSMPLALVVGIVVGLAVFGGAFTLLASFGVSVAVVGAYAAFWVVTALILRGPLRGRASGKRTLGIMGVESAALACVLAVVGTGGLGYAGAVPQTSEVASVSVSYTGSPSYLACGFDSAMAGDGTYYYSATYDFDDADDIEAVRSVHESLTSTGGKSLGEDADDFGATVVPYDVVVRYTLADGGELVRYYDRASLDELAALAALDESQHVRELASAVVSGDTSLLDEDEAADVASCSARQAFAQGDIYLSDRLYANPRLLNCDAQARSSLLAALARDVAAQSAQDRYYPQGECRGVIMFTQAGESAAETFAYSIENTVVYLTDEFTNTLAWLEENGLGGYLTLEDESAYVESITVERYDPFGGMNAVTQPQSAYFMGYRASVGEQFIVPHDFGTYFTTDDAAEMSELLECARNMGYLNEGGYLLSVKLRGADAWAYLLVPASDAPDWLVRVAS